MNRPQRHIGISFGALRTFHDGLGEFSLQLGQQLALAAPALRDEGTSLSYHLPREFHGHFGPDVHYLQTGVLQRLVHLRRQRFDLWHSLHQFNRFKPPWRSQRRVQTVHDLNFMVLKQGDKAQRYLRRLRARLAPCRAVIAISEFVRDDLRRHVGEGSPPVHVIYNGVRDLTRAVQQPIERLADRPFFLHISRMAPSKNIDALIALADHWREPVFVFAGGSSPYASDVAGRVRRAGLHHVHLLLDINDAQKAWLYAHCAAFLFPSFTEGFGLPPLEAMAFGKPVFLSDRTSLPEVGGDAATYWHDFAPASMRAAIEDTLARWTDADAARARARAQRFTWQRCADEHLALYRRLLAS